MAHTTGNVFFFLALYFILLLVLFCSGVKQGGYRRYSWYRAQETMWCQGLNLGLLHIKSYKDRNPLRSPLHSWLFIDKQCQGRRWSPGIKVHTADPGSIPRAPLGIDSQTQSQKKPRSTTICSSQHPHKENQCQSLVPTNSSEFYLLLPEGCCQYPKTPKLYSPGTAKVGPSQ